MSSASRTVWGQNEDKVLWTQVDHQENTITHEFMLTLDYLLPPHSNRKLSSVDKSYNWTCWGVCAQFHFIIPVHRRFWVKWCANQTEQWIPWIGELWRSTLMRRQTRSGFIMWLRMRRMGPKTSIRIEKYIQCIPLFHDLTLNNGWCYV